MGADNLDEAEEEVFRQRSADAQAAMRLVQSLRQVRIYLLSRLQEDIVESLGLAYVDNPREIGNLSRRSDTCILLSNAQNAWPSVHKIPVPKT
jgi:hypothetical protein